MVDEHLKAAAKLKEIAEKKGIVLSDRLDQEHRDKIQELSQYSGREFDREYMKHGGDHKQDLDSFQEQADDGRDAALKQFASQTIPKLEQHLKQAEQISAQM